MTGRPESPVPFVAGMLAALLGAVLWTAPLGAHGLKVECEVTNENRIQIKISYEDGGVADLAAVRLLELTADGEEPAAVIAEGKADEKGVFSSPRPKQAEFRLEAKHAGHLESVRVKIDPGGAVSLEPLEQEPHDHSQKRIIQTILVVFLIVIGARLLVRLIRGRPSNPTARETPESKGSATPDGGTGPNEATEPNTSAPAPDASPKEE